MNNRDTQFKGFAKLVQDELIAIEAEGHKHNWNNIDIYRKQREVLARRAYDLVQHAFENTYIVSFGTLTTEENVERIPDLTEPPKENQ